jgi:hypothetical protein
VPGNVPASHFTSRVLQIAAGETML